MLKLILSLCVLSLVACGNSSTIEISAPGATGSVQIISLSSNEVVAEKTIESGKAQFGAAELGLGAFEVRIKNQNLSAVVSSDFLGNTIQVNPLTTLAACRFRKMKDIDTQNKLIAAQFKISDLQKVAPNLDFKNIEILDEAAIYGILIGGFAQLAIDQKQTIEGLVGLLCEDLSLDGMLNGVSAPLYDEQVLKVGYANAIFSFSQNEIPAAAKLPIEAFANEISISAVSGLFSPSIVNYSFDH